jgi:hypothetical protein
MDRMRMTGERQRAQHRADSLTGERAIRGGVTGGLSATASNIIKAFGGTGGTGGTGGRRFGTIKTPQPTALDIARRIPENRRGI